MLALAVVLVCLAIHWLWITRMKIPTVDPLKLKNLSLLYLCSAPLLVINTFLFFFHEAYCRAASSAQIKLLATTASLVVTLSVFWASGSHNFIYFSGGFFVLLEALTLFLYRRLSRKRSLSFRPLLSVPVIKDILALGIPAACGLGIQKLYFLLFSDRLIRIDSERVSVLSVSMSIIGLLVIPVAAFSQLHSLYIGSKTRALLSYNRTGSACLLILVVGLAGLFLLFNDEFFRFFANDQSLIPKELPPAVVALFLATALINFSMGQLRALKDTLVPQAIIGAALLLGLYPLIASQIFDGASLSAFLYAEAAALLGCYVALQYRTHQVGRRQNLQHA